MSNSTLTSVVEMEPLETTSLPKPISAMDDSPNDSPAAKDGQDSGHSLGDSSKDEPTPEDHFTEISHTSNTQPTLTQKDTDFLSGVLFLKHVLEWQVSGNRDITQLVSNLLDFAPPQADSNDDPQVTTAAKSKNQSTLTTNNSPAFTKKRPSSLQSSGTTKKPSKSTQHGANTYKPSVNESRKRVRSESCDTITIHDTDEEVIPDSEDEDDGMAVTPTLPTPPSHSARDLATAAGDSARPNKRLRVTKGNNAMPATARSSSPESSAKASSDEEAKGRRKPRTRVTENEFRGHIKREKTWLDTASSGCSNIRRVFTQQKNFLEELEAIEKEFSHIVTDLSVEQAISRQARLRLSGELEHVEERRRRVISNLRKAMTRGSTEGDEMKQNLEKWCVKDSKVTSRIERSH